jgi:hypothetical protein
MINITCGLASVYVCSSHDAKRIGLGYKDATPQKSPKRCVEVQDSRPKEAQENSEEIQKVGRASALVAHQTCPLCTGQSV